MTLHDDVLDAEAREKERQRQADEAAADDQNGDVLVTFDPTPTLPRAGGRAKRHRLRPFWSATAAALTLSNQARP
jgi:hypothetical protein